MEMYIWLFLEEPSPTEVDQVKFQGGGVICFRK